MWQSQGRQNSKQAKGSSTLTPSGQKAAGKQVPDQTPIPESLSHHPDDMWQMCLSPWIWIGGVAALPLIKSSCGREQVEGARLATTEADTKINESWFCGACASWQREIRPKPLPHQAREDQ